MQHSPRWARTSLGASIPCSSHSSCCGCASRRNEERARRSSTMRPSRQPTRWSAPHTTRSLTSHTHCRNDTNSEPTHTPPALQMHGQRVGAQPPAPLLASDEGAVNAALARLVTSGSRGVPEARMAGCDQVSSSCSAPYSTQVLSRGAKTCRNPSKWCRTLQTASSTAPSSAVVGAASSSTSVVSAPSALDAASPTFVACPSSSSLPSSSAALSYPSPGSPRSSCSRSRVSRVSSRSREASSATIAKAISSSM
mmetsp:Transcript_37875/g.122484  ORF Transcript_37875/g.122484 Transcript_37875/m.122484 type:complete len:253 (-) Transcript_37875:278-1036(-)